MSGNPSITNIFLEFQKNIDAEQQTREVIRLTCRDIEVVFRDISTALQEIHYSTQIELACTKAREQFVKVKEGYAKLISVIPPADYYRYYDHWRSMTQRFCFIITLTVYLEDGTLASHQMVADVLGVSAVEGKTGFHLDIDDYLMGVLQVSSELARFAMNSVTRGEFSRPMKIYKFVMEINSAFRVLNLKNDFLRKRFDALKYDVKKIEEVVYDLSIRGMLPKDGE